jgi:hypothetical protein
MVLLAWWISYRCGASVDLQLYVVVASALMATFGLCISVRMSRKRDGIFYRMLLAIGRKTHMENSGIWMKFRDMLDNRFNTNSNN